MPEEQLSYRRLLLDPDLAALLAAAGLSRLAARMLTVVIVLYALGRFASPALAGWLSFAAVAPGLVASPLAGAILDRVGARRAVILDVAASAVLVAGLAAADRLGHASVPALFALVALYSLTSPLGAAGVRTLLPALVSAEMRPRANALDTALYAATDVAGPALAGLLTGFAGPDVALLCVALAAAGAAAFIARIGRKGEIYARPQRASLLEEAWEGLLYVLREPTLRGLAVGYSLFQVSGGALIVLVPVLAGHLAGDTLRDFAAGLLFAIGAAASGFGAMLSGHIRLSGREAATMICGMLATAAALWPLVAYLGGIGLVLGLCLGGFAGGAVDVALLTLRQRRTEVGRLGRVLSISMSLNVLGFPLGSALAGVLSGHSVTLALAVAAAASLLAALASHWLIPRCQSSDPSLRASP